MNTTKKGVRVIAETCASMEIRKVVLSPGSRSAPLVIAFSQLPSIECMVLPDERVAGYFALGMAQQLNEPVALICTSGTAVLNLVPAACEAFYQQIPLLLITADRPKGAHTNGENQAIAQENIIHDFCKYEISVNGDADTPKELQTIKNETSKAIQLSRQNFAGPSHLNVYLSEPLYETGAEKLPALKATKTTTKEYSIPASVRKQIKSTFSTPVGGQGAKKLIVVGMRDKDAAFTKKLEQLNQRSDIVVLTESLANLPVKNTVWNYEACMAAIGKDGAAFVPDIVISMGGQIISKRLKAFLKNKPKVHWDIPTGTSTGRGWSAFGNILQDWQGHSEIQFLDTLLSTQETASTFKKEWLQLSSRVEKITNEHLAKTAFTDLKVFEALISSLPGGANVQYGNSTPVRYSNLFKHRKDITINANRGTSGIDGCLSTATGAAYSNGKPTVCILGDVSFLYDSNALWNNYLSPNLRIVVINNSGGNIFRFLDGPMKVKGFEKLFETRHQLSAKHLAAMHQIPYYYCNAKNGLDKILKNFYSPQKGRPAILEIKTDGKKSAEAYRAYFKLLEQLK